MASFTLGGKGNPQILTELCSYSQFRKLLAGEDQTAAKRHALIPDGDLIPDILPRGKMSLLIKFIVVGNVGLRHKSQDISMIQYSCRIVKLAIFPHRKTYKISASTSLVSSARVSRLSHALSRSLLCKTDPGRYTR